jgi:RND family efflux transporter MFP subunit
MNRHAVWLLAGGLLVAACSKQETTGPKGAKGDRKLEYPVEVAPLAPRHVQYTVTSPGTLEAFQQVQITARVSGAVDKVSFTEGEVVKEGQVLVTIESERYKVAVDQAKASVAKAQANQHQAEQQLARRQGAVDQHPGLIPGEELSTFETSVATAKADVLAAEQARRVAELNLRDAFVRAPIAGVVQTRTVQTGQYLQTGAVLATILQRDPLLLRFQVTEQDAPRIKPGMTANLMLRESTRVYTATITLVAGAADPNTRLVPVTARLDTTDHQYWLRPGAYCEVTVPVGNAREAIVIPTVAVQPTAQGNLTYVVEGNKAKARYVTLGMHTPEGGVEVTRGLKPGELLVVRGIDALTDNAPVKVSARTTVEEVESVDAGTPPGPLPADPSGPAGSGSGAAAPPPSGAPAGSGPAPSPSALSASPSARPHRGGGGAAP